MSHIHDDDQDFKFDLDSIVDLVQVDQLKATFFEESQTLLSDLEGLITALEREPENSEVSQTLFRKIHTLKGNVGSIPGGQLVGSIAHEFEAVLGKIKDAGLEVNEQILDIFFKSARIIKNLIKALQEQREIYPEELSESIELISEFSSLSFTIRERPARDRSDKKDLVQSQQKGIWLSSEMFESLTKISGELLVLKNSYASLKALDAEGNKLAYEQRQNDFLLNLTKISDQFQTYIKTASHEKTKNLFKGLYVLVRQISTELNKDVQFSIEGEDVLLDKFFAREIYDSLVHIIRNSLDHGIEDQFERATQGKSPTGTIKLSVVSTESEVEFRIQDDGQGLSKDRIVQKAIAKGLVDLETVEKMSESEIYSLIFEHGFSTRDRVTTMSGRGVGMDVVKTSVEKLRGTIELHSEETKGLGITIRTPHLRHMMIENILLCHWNNKILAFPLKNVERVIPMEELSLNCINDETYAQVDGRTLLLAEYSHLFTASSPRSYDRGCAVILKDKEQAIALYIDGVEEQTELVVKNFDSLVEKQLGCKGLSILPDDRIVYIIDPEELVGAFFLRNQSSYTEAA